MSAVEKYVAPPAQQLTVAQVQYIANTEMVPKAYRGKVPEIMACILTGRGLGLEDMHALRSIYVVDGKATLSAELMVFLIRREGHSITGKSSATSAEVTGTRADNGDSFTVTYTIEEAEAAGLVDKKNWQKHPADMLWARCVSRLARRLFADVLGGISHVPDEALMSPEDKVDEAIGVVRAPTDDDGPDDTPAGKREDGGGPEASVTDRQAGGEAADKQGASPAPGFARVPAGAEIIEEADFEPVEDSSGKGAESRGAGEPQPPEPRGGPDDQAPGLAAPSPEPAPHTEDTGQGSIFERMAAEAIDRKAGAERDNQ